MSPWKWLIDEIPKYEDGCISMDELAHNLNLSERDLRRFIAAARRNGEIICSTSLGYYRPTTVPQIGAHARYMLSRVESSWESLSPALHVMRDWDPSGSQTRDVWKRLANLNEIITHEVQLYSDSSKSKG